MLGNGYIIYFRERIDNYMIMTEEIIKTKLGFLISDYGFEFSSNSDGMREWYKFTNNYGSLNWYAFEQFEEYKLYIEINGKGEQVLDSYRIGNILNVGEWPFLRIFSFKDQRVIYWNRIADLLKKEINETGTLFGIILKR